MRTLTSVLLALTSAAAAQDRWSSNTAITERGPVLASAAYLLTQTGPDHLVLTLAVNVRVRSITLTPRRADLVVLYTSSGTPLYYVATDTTVRPGGVRFPPPRHSAVNADLTGTIARRLLKEGGLLTLTVDTDRALALPGGGAGSLGHVVVVKLTPR